MVVVVLYLTAFLISIVNLVLLFMVSSRRSAYYVLTFVTMAVSNAGYFALALSKSLEEAILANKMAYFGGCFLPFYMFLCVASLCKYKTRLWWVMGLGGFACVVMGFVLSIGYSPIYYKAVSLNKINGIVQLEKIYGPAHNLYYILLVGCVFSIVYVIAYSFFKQKKVSYKNTICLAILFIVTVATYVGQKFLDNYVEMIPFSYIISGWIILILVRKIEMYDVSNSVEQTTEKYGYIVFDDDKNFLSANEIAISYFPELEELKVDYPVSEKNTVIYNNIMPWLDDCDEKGQDAIHFYSLKNKELKCSVNYIFHGRKGKKIGYLVEIIDETEQLKYIQLLNHYNTELEEAVLEQTEQLREMQDKLTLGMAELLESRDSSTGGHIKRTSTGVRIFVDELQKHKDKYPVTPQFYKYVIKAAPMHDLGKIAVDDSILRKPGRFTEEEFNAMKVHAARGAEIVANLLADVEDDEFAKIAKNVAHYHHEKWNGQGYPEQLSGEEIPLEARIMALADVFDALVSKRCYKEQMSFDEAFAIIKESLGSHFDPELGNVFLQCRSRLEAYYSLIV